MKQKRLRIVIIFIIFAFFSCEHEPAENKEEISKERFNYEPNTIGYFKYLRLMFASKNITVEYEPQYSFFNYHSFGSVATWYHKAVIHYNLEHKEYYSTFDTNLDMDTNYIAVGNFFGRTVPHYFAFMRGCKADRTDNSQMNVSKIEYVIWNSVWANGYNSYEINSSATWLETNLTESEIRSLFPDFEGEIYRNNERKFHIIQGLQANQAEFYEYFISGDTMKATK
jgi:hypothetical protein